VPAHTRKCLSARLTPPDKARTHVPSRSLLIRSGLVNRPSSRFTCRRRGGVRDRLTRFMTVAAHAAAGPSLSLYFLYPSLPVEYISFLNRKKTLACMVKHLEPHTPVANISNQVKGRIIYYEIEAEVLRDTASERGVYFGVRTCCSDSRPRAAARVGRVEHRQQAKLWVASWPPIFIKLPRPGVTTTATCIL
jgi:hypothetical protein